jgi:hypothetical protein
MENLLCAVYNAAEDGVAEQRKSEREDGGKGGRIGGVADDEGRTADKRKG